MNFQNVVLAVLLTLAVGWLLVAGRFILLPLFAAILAVYLVLGASEGLTRLPLLRMLPRMVLTVLVLAGFSLIVLSLSFLIGATVREIAAIAPTYEANLDQLIDGIATRFELEKQHIWDELRAMSVDRIDIGQVFFSLLGGFTQVGSTVFLIVLYAVFIVGERGTMQQKIIAVSKSPDKARATLRVLKEINAQISSYLTLKTLINIGLAALSWLVLLAFGIDFALFWAILIGFLNYIPYVGSYIGVAFPVVLSVAQFGSLSLTLMLAAMLTVAQVMVGNVLEPRLIGWQMNLSPLVVLIALSIWTALWGIPGAILAVPLTAVLAIVLSHFEKTRSFAVLLAQQVKAPDQGKTG